MEEIWKPIPLLHGKYEASNKGNIRSLPRQVNMYQNGIIGKKTINGKVLKPQNNGNGYKYVAVSFESKRKNYYVHRLVADAFLENSESLPQVNHKDGNKENNAVTNLEWCSVKENLIHAFATGLKSNENTKSSIRVLDKETGNVFPTIRSAANFFNVKYGLLKEALNRNSECRNPIYARLVKIGNNKNI